ncbi:peptidoglycan/LPS O-acetylase OafA/YrhL [Bradyrhizobium japonicum]
MSADSKNFVEAIQGLRGVAALTVLIVHLQDMPLLAGFLPPIWPWLEATVNMGGHGVELFFMISGFLIPASLMRHRSVGKFFLDRALRILPVFVILHLILFTAGPLVGYKFFKGIDLPTYLKLFFVNLAFLPDALGLPIGQQNAWTLSYEWAFYILFAVIFVMLVQRRNWLLAAPFILLGLAGIAFRPIAAFFLVGAVVQPDRFADPRRRLARIAGGRPLRDRDVRVDRICASAGRAAAGRAAVWNGPCSGLRNCRRFERQIPAVPRKDQLQPLFGPSFCVISVAGHRSEAGRAWRQSLAPLGRVRGPRPDCRTDSGNGQLRADRSETPPLARSGAAGPVVRSAP